MTVEEEIWRSDMHVNDTEVKFISYDGEPPTLCSGSLTIEIAGVQFRLPEHTFESGGSVTFDDEWEETITEGPWKFDEYAEIPEELEPFREKILEVMNENVEHGCCGGCV